MVSISDIQRALAAGGFDPGPIDGAWGRRSIAAAKLFQKARGLTVDGVIGSATLAALMPNLPKAWTPLPVWYAEAQRLKGVRETPGAKSSAVILGWAAAFGGWVKSAYRDDATPWCGLFAGHCIGVTLPAEVLPSNPLSALAWAKFGEKLAKPSLGAICVFSRKGGGHVGFYAGEDAEAVHVLGGNQSDAVTITRVSKSRLVAYRWPLTAPAATGGAVARADTGALSRNEA